MTSTTLRYASVLVIGLALAVPASPAGAAEQGAVVTTVSAADRAAAVSYWTSDRIRQLSADDRLPPAETVAQLWDGPLPPGVGRLFLTMEPGGDESCTATAVPSSSGDVAFTAGHCANGGFTRDDQPVKATHVVFAPGYHDGTAPYGMFPARAFAWSDTYGGPSSSLDDDAVLALDPVGGKHVADAAGTQDISFGKVESPVDTTAVGYPVSRLAKGETPESCRLPSTLSTNSVYSSWNSTCDMAGGSSGGPWLRNFDPATGKGTIFSVTSKGTVNEDGTTAKLDGSAFTDAVRSLYDGAGSL
jgi:V8-like Glu-specific endopeptidase